MRLPRTLSSATRPCHGGVASKRDRGAVSLSAFQCRRMLRAGFKHRAVVKRRNELFTHNQLDRAGAE